MKEVISNFIENKNHKEVMIFYMYILIIGLITLSLFVDIIRADYMRLDINIVALLVFVLGFYLYMKSTHSSRVEISMSLMVLVSEVILLSMVLRENFLNYTTVFPMLITFAIFYFYTLRQALWMSFGHLLFWVLVYIYGYYQYPDHTLLHNTRAMLGLGISYLFMTMFGLIYYLSTYMYQSRLEKANLQQELLLKEIHHRVKNNLNIVSSMLGIQQMTETDTRIIESMKKNRLRINAIAMIHEILYKHDDFSQINFRKYIIQLFEAIKEMYHEDMTLSVSAKEVYLPLDIVLKLGIITNELTVNSLKYAFKGNKGEIMIDFYVTEDIITYTYADSGVCIKEKNEIWKHANLGLKLIQMMTKQMNAEIKVEEAKGLAYKIRIPV